MRKRAPLRTNTASPSRRWVAYVLLAAVVFLVVNPIFEAQDRMDNVVHFGSNGFLLIVLLIACAGAMLLKSLLWISPNTLGVFLPSPQTSAMRPTMREKLLCILSVDLQLPLRV